MLSRNDFVLLRQNIAASQIFDTVFISLVSSFLFGRAFYMIDNFKIDLIGILPFFHIIKYPGLSIFGIFFGGALCFYLIFMKKKGLGRIADILSISFLPLYAVSLFFEKYGIFYFLPFILFGLCVLLFILFLQFHYKYLFRDGSISLLFIIFICATTLAAQYMGNAKGVIFTLPFIAVFSIILLVGAFVLFVLNQRKKAT